MGRISLDLWGILEDLYFDADSIFETEPDPDYFLCHPHRAAGHYHYWASTHRAKGIGITILGVACLEAYINEIIQLEPRLEDKTRDKLRHLRIRDKYLAFIGQFTTEQPLLRAEPFRSFDLLVRVRNALVHFSGGRPEATTDWWGPQICHLLSTNKCNQERLIECPGSVVHDEYPAWVRGVLSQLLSATNNVIVDKTLCLDPGLSAIENAAIWDAAISRPERMD